MTRLRPGTLVQLDDGTIASATYDAREGTYRTAQRNPVTGGTRVDTGWQRDQLQVVEVVDPARQLLAAQIIRDRLKPTTAGAWLTLSAADRQRRISALELASRRVAELAQGCEVRS